MAEIKIAGVMRSGVFSPNHIGNDAAIFNLVADQLRKRGCEVNIYSEEQFASSGVAEDIIVDMCRELRSIERLERLEDAGALVINSGYGIENCIRERMARIFLGSGVPYPESFIVDTDEVVKDRLVKAGFTGCWIKRADSHTRHREDVAYARHPQEAQEIVQEFFLRGIKRAVINRNIEGEHVKFYGVAGTKFFHWFYPAASAQPRHIADRLAGAAHVGFDAAALKELCSRAAELLDVKIYGGDCIIDADGQLRIVDFDDWPSFASCRGEAAPVIARMVMNEIKKRNQ